MGISVNDLNEVDAWTGTGMLPPGRHEVKIAEATEGQSSGGHDQVEMRFEALNGTGDIRDWLVFTPATLGKARMLLDAVGIAAESGQWTFPTEQLPGKTLAIVVGEEPDRQEPGKMRRRVMSYQQAAGGNGGGGGSSDLPF